MKLTVALAITKENHLKNAHFGDCDAFQLYEWTGDCFQSKGILDNIYKNASENRSHGDAKKGSDITAYLKNNQVNTLVAKQFGKNIKMVNQHFIPTIVATSSIDETLQVLESNIKWLIEELQSNKTDYKLFDLRKGCIKLNIKNPKKQKRLSINFL